MSQAEPADGLPSVDPDAAPPDSPQPPQDDAPPPMDGSGPQELEADEL